MECPESIEELKEMETLIPLCKVTLYEQAQARLKKNPEKSERQIAKEMAKELDKDPGVIRTTIQRGAKEVATLLPEAVKLKELNLTEHDKKVIVSHANKIKKSIKETKQEERKNKIQEFLKTEIIEKNNSLWEVELGDINHCKIDKSFDFIITDPPYPKKYLELYDILSIRSVEWLKPDGLLIVLSGQSYLDEIHKKLSEHLTYYWTACYLTPGQPTPLRHRQVNTSWKPILIYSMSEKYNGKIFGDVFKSDGPDKTFHEWGQSESGMSSIIQQICLPGQSILDPFCGTGTTGISAIKHGCYFYGIDKSEECIEISKKRLSEIEI